MPSSRIANRESLESARSQLGQTLIRLHAAVEQNRRHEHHIDGVFTDWQQSWSNRREQIARRLASIESQLEQLAADAPDSRPRLSVVGLPPEYEEDDPMESY